MQGAIGRKADGVYASLKPEQQAIVRNIFVRLTALGEGTQDTRRRAPLAELVGSGPKAEQFAAVLKVLEDNHLITAEREQLAAANDEPDATVYVDVTHEATIRAWARLDDWLHADRERLRIHRRLTEAAQAWVDEWRRDPHALSRGVQLQQAQEWAAEAELDSELNDLEQAFLTASVAQAAAEQREQEQIANEREVARARELAQAQALAVEQARRASEIVRKGTFASCSPARALWGSRMTLGVCAAQCVAQTPSSARLLPL